MYIKSRALASLIALTALFGIVQAPPFSQAAGEKKLEVFSWWTSGGEAAAACQYYKKHTLARNHNATSPPPPVVNERVSPTGKLVPSCVHGARGALRRHFSKR